MADLDHIARTELPWRTGVPRTECGLTNTPALTMDEFIAKARREGQQRAALTTCMTCWDKRVFYGRVAQDKDELVDVMAREVSRVQRSRGPEARQAFERELQAIAALIDAHRDEFDEALAGLSAAPSLDAARRRRIEGQRRA